MDFGLSFSYVFKDKDWFKKVAIAALVSLIPIVGQFIVVGWGLKAAKNVIEGKVVNALPDLDFGADLGRGFMAFLINLIYGLPIGILGGISAALFSAGGNARENFVSILLMVIGGCFGLIVLLLILVVIFMGTAAVANYLAKGSFGAAFKFKEVFGLVKKSFVSWLLVIAGQILAMAIIAPLGGVACGIGVLLTTAYALAVYSHLLGQAYNQSAASEFVSVETL